MFVNNVLILSLAAFVLADPIPQAAATTTDLGSSPSDIGSSPSQIASESDALASISSLEALESSMPTLAPSAGSAIVSAIPTGYLTGKCQTTTPGWYYSLPADVKSAISSFDSAFATWYSAHSTDLDLTATLPDNICAGTVFISGSGDATTTLATATASTGHTTVTGGATVTGSSSGSGTAATGTSGPSTSSSKAAAPQVTGLVGASLAGVVGVFGLMVAL